jgi:hypothetical protein
MALYHVPEVYAFHIFLIALTTYFVCDYSNKPTLSKKYFICLLCGIGLLIIKALYFLFPDGFIFYGAKKEFYMNEWLKTSFFFLLGCLPLLYAPIISFRHHPLDWEMQKNYWLFQAYYSCIIWYILCIFWIYTEYF